DAAREVYGSPIPKTRRRTRTGVRSAPEAETKLREETVRADLGQKEAELKRSSKERMEHGRRKAQITRPSFASSVFARKRRWLARASRLAGVASAVLPQWLSTAIYFVTYANVTGPAPDID